MVALFTEVWLSLGNFFSDMLNNLLSLFYTPGVDGGTGSLTFIGVISVITVGIGLILLLIRTIKGFMALRS